MNYVKIDASKFKPCPFCGKHDRLEAMSKSMYQELVEENDKACVVFTCKRCNLDLYDHNYQYTDYTTRMEMLRMKWNRRPYETD